MTCESVRERLSAFLSEELETEEQSRITDHLEICWACRQEWEQLREAIAVLKTAPAPTPPPYLADRIRLTTWNQQWLVRRATLVRQWTFALAAGLGLFLIVIAYPWIEMMRERSERREESLPAVASAPAMMRQDRPRALEGKRFADVEKPLLSQPEGKKVIPSVKPPPSPRAGVERSQRRLLAEVPAATSPGVFHSPDSPFPESVGELKPSAAEHEQQSQPFPTTPPPPASSQELEPLQRRLAGPALLMENTVKEEPTLRQEERAGTKESKTGTERSSTERRRYEMISPAPAPLQKGLGGFGGQGPGELAGLGGIAPFRTQDRFAVLSAPALGQFFWIKVEPLLVSSPAVFVVGFTPETAGPVQIRAKPELGLEVINLPPSPAGQTDSDGEIAFAGPVSAEKPGRVTLVLRTSQAGARRLRLTAQTIEGLRESWWVIVPAITPGGFSSNPSFSFQGQNWVLMDLLLHLAWQSQRPFLVPASLTDRPVFLNLEKASVTDVLSQVKRLLQVEWEERADGFRLTVPAFSRSQAVPFTKPAHQ
ncbi:MAG: zf-HC2 domain-containing protein [Armatimonadetes bacterium]|nr:zf-HC2 domain-containing protein [Armatimonadota bacterium]MDW8122613.1 zf-HC2 domain-containing protein [Armatimonadota bacterium]